MGMARMGSILRIHDGLQCLVLVAQSVDSVHWRDRRTRNRLLGASRSQGRTARLKLPCQSPTFVQDASHYAPFPQKPFSDSQRSKRGSTCGRAPPNRV
jgi:hypothetical protein